MGHNFAKAQRDAIATEQRFKNSLAAVAAGRLARLRNDLSRGGVALSQPNLVNTDATPPQPRPEVPLDMAQYRYAQAFSKLSLKQRKKVLAAKRRARSRLLRQ